MTSKVTYLGGLRCEAVHLQSGQKIVTDAPVDNQGRGEAFSPTDLAATSLAVCAMTIMGIAAQNHGLEIDGAEAEITKIMAAAPRRIARVEVKFLMPKKAFSSKEKRLLEAAARACPVALSLSENLEQSLEFVWF